MQSLYNHAQKYGVTYLAPAIINEEVVFVACVCLRCLLQLQQYGKRLQIRHETFRTGKNDHAIKVKGGSTLQWGIERGLLYLTSLV